MLYADLLSDALGQETYRYYSAPHKRSELKKTYNEIVRLSKDSPSYIIPQTEDTKKFAIQLKENSLFLQDTLEKLQSGDITSAFSYKEVSVDDSSALSAEIDTDDHANLPDNFEIQIDKLAKPQVNTGDYVYPDTIRITPGQYTLLLHMDGQDYPYTLEFSSKQNNEMILTKLAQTINHSSVPITASTNYDKKHEKIRMVLKSEQTGSPDGQPIFSLEDLSYPSNAKGLIDFFHLDHVSQNAENSLFYINDKEQTTLANEFTLNNSLRLTLHHETTEPVHVTFEGNSARVIHSINTLADTYNSLIYMSYHQGDPPKMAALLLHDLRGLFSSDASTLKDCGIQFDEEGYMLVDETQAAVAVKSGDFERLFGQGNDVGNNIIKKSQIFTMDPLKYLENKIMVTYPNPTKEHFANPYLTSLYSGLLFNSCC